MGRPLREIEIGEWFQNLDTAELFEVVAIDDDSRTVEVQYFDGTVEEFEFESWPQLQLEQSAPPEDWSGAFDADREDLDSDWLHAQEGDPMNEVDQLLY